MSSSITLSPSRPKHRIVAILLLCVAALAAWFIAHSALRYMTLNPDAFGPYFRPRRYGLLLHITGGLVALTVGLVQLWLGATGRTRGLHRRLGRAYIVGVVVASVGALYLAFTIPAGAWVYASGLVGLATAWLVTTSLAYVAIRHGRQEQHREWMTRSYVVTFAFVTFRFFAETLTAMGVGTETEVSAFCAWFCWAVPLLHAEVLIQFRKLARAPVRLH